MGLHFLQSTLSQKNIPMLEDGRKSHAVTTHIHDDIVGSVVYTSEAEDTSEQNKHLMEFYFMFYLHVFSEVCCLPQWQQGCFEDIIQSLDQ